ncbi:hypothetical protein Cfor_05225 [Coptotermes formosanus]|jgi:hypothetical protein|uniref:Uncharacterized protein n=1 Tax=Coptotermes formosanus TaxID=36987 RepID=A0A6L2Q9S0_COPFO|nr:hypothetical protein Cfor_05225 [Coptotermes formosanus]
MFLISACDIEQLKRFASGGYCDESTIVYLQHPCVVLTALEVLGYEVVASSSTSIKQDYNEYMWTMRKEFSEPEPVVTKPSKNFELVARSMKINMKLLGKAAYLLSCLEVITSKH